MLSVRLLESLSRLQDRRGLIPAQRTIGHGGQAQLARATIPLKAVEQHFGSPGPPPLPAVPRCRAGAIEAKSRSSSAGTLSRKLS